MSLRRLARPLLLLSSLLVAAGYWAFVHEPASLVVADYEIAPRNWPLACDGLRVAVLADLHVGAPGSDLGKLRRIVEETNAAGPDIVLLAGDYVVQGVVGGEFVAPEKFAPVLGELRAPGGTHAVLGNHDHWLDADRVERALAGAGLAVHEDRSTSVLHGDCRFSVAGVSDYTEAAHDVHAALDAIPIGEPIIALTHNPDVFPAIPSRVGLTVAGHTHGGQVVLPILGRPIVPSEHGERYAIAHVHERGRDLFVSPGLGTSILPVRFRVPPEISVLTLRAD